MLLVSRYVKILHTLTREKVMKAEQKLWNELLIQGATKNHSLMYCMIIFLKKFNPPQLDADDKIIDYANLIKYIEEIDLKRCLTEKHGSKGLQFYTKIGANRFYKIKMLDFIFMRSMPLVDAILHPKTNHSLIIEYIDRYPWQHSITRAKSKEIDARKSKASYAKKTGPKQWFKSRDVKTEHSWNTVS